MSIWRGQDMNNCVRRLVPCATDSGGMVTARNDIEGEVDGVEAGHNGIYVSREAAYGNGQAEGAGEQQRTGGGAEGSAQPQLVDGRGGGVVRAGTLEGHGRQMEAGAQAVDAQAVQELMTGTQAASQTAGEQTSPPQPPPPPVPWQPPARLLAPSERKHVEIPPIPLFPDLEADAVALDVECLPAGKGQEPVVPREVTVVDSSKEVLLHVTASAGFRAESQMESADAAQAIPLTLVQLMLRQVLEGKVVVGYSVQTSLMRLGIPLEDSWKYGVRSILEIGDFPAFRKGKAKKKGPRTLTSLSIDFLKTSVASRALDRCKAGMDLFLYALNEYRQFAPTFLQCEPLAPRRQKKHDPQSPANSITEEGDEDDDDCDEDDEDDEMDFADVDEDDELHEDYQLYEDENSCLW